MRFISDIQDNLSEVMEQQFYNASLHMPKYSIAMIPKDSLDEIIRIIKDSSRNLFNHDVQRITKLAIYN